MFVASVLKCNCSYDSIVICAHFIGVLEYEVFYKPYEKLSEILPVSNIINKLISAKIITFDDSEVIRSEPRSQYKAIFVLNIVAKSLKLDVVDDFYSLLRIMEDYEGTVAKVANKIREELK